MVNTGDYDDGMTDGQTIRPEDPNFLGPIAVMINGDELLYKSFFLNATPYYWSYKRTILIRYS